jgi:hypothetical protein
VGTGGSFPGSKAAGAWSRSFTSLYTAEVNVWIYTSIPTCVFMAWCLVKHRNNFTLQRRDSCVRGFCTWRFRCSCSVGRAAVPLWRLPHHGYVRPDCGPLHRAHFQQITETVSTDLLNATGNYIRPETDSQLCWRVWGKAACVRNAFGFPTLHTRYIVRSTDLIGLSLSYFTTDSQFVLALSSRF